ncbi:two pore domain potassium channel family protein [Mesorhizobium sp. M4B.F.Ca.ET.143.01.1.1]|uniref:two pore domain potassium channel family protein n=1 Tax=Mesorhizobium sp. M4B.F.Ca.ET.143.01.1.1 TaxID=2563947 RepID=UPI001FEF22E8|nr:two pore domain potassium channel family protein [Mesorhizobium sp. M4B.F.Ca.ET.143.01.1.1]
MILNLCVGTIVISLTVLIHTFGLIAITHVMTHLVALFRMHGRRSRIVAMISVVMGLFVVMTAEVWLWAGIYRLLGILSDFETAFIFRPSLFRPSAMGTWCPPMAGESWRRWKASTGFC